MGIIFRKTAKGVDEVRHRTHRLTPRDRSTLILVDGVRSDDDLAKLIQVQPGEALQRLADGGFIEAVATTAPPAPPPAAAAPPPQQHPIDIVALRRLAVRKLLDHVGPDGETLAMRIEAATDIEALRPLLGSARTMIARTRGERAAADYIAALSAL